ncbi:hypothetical protein L596_014636 [Steinernema carpocapsae]|nr:hypothetical protein L596_014636 [Steinernema carpocapsae]
MLTAWLLLSIAAIASGKPLLGAVFFSVLLNFKHLYLYYVPAFVAHYLLTFLLPLDSRIFSRFVKLGLAVGGPLILSFGPFLAKGGSELIGQIFSRLFPFHRGLTHAFWAPNFWALYNAGDFVLFQITKKFPQYFKFTPEVPQYTSGLEYSHSVLWNVSPPASLALILVALTPVFLRRLRRPRGDIIVDLVLCSFAFFFFGWHVHEKAILMIAIPLTVLAIKDYRYMSCFMMLSASGYVAILPLFFTPPEDLFKYIFLSTWILLSIVLSTSTLMVPYSLVLLSCDVFYISGLVAVETYNVFIHKVIFKDSMPFLPLLATSIYCALGILLAYIRFLFLTFAGESHESLKRRCIQFEDKCKAQKTLPSISEVDIRYIGGVDISTCKTNNALAVISYTVLSYPDLKVVHEADKVEFIPVPYVNNFLAMREAEPMSNLILESSKRFPEFRADVILVDANGRYHSRKFGLACHIGHLCGIPTIGVSKSFNLSPLLDLGAAEADLKDLEKEITRTLEGFGEPGYLPLRFTDPILVHAVRTEHSKIPVFVSVGYRIDLEEASEIVFNCCLERIPLPIRLSDLRSRELVRHYYEGT